MRAYGYNRPLGMGCYPKGHRVTEIINFEHGKQWVEEVGKSCFGYVDFEDDVPVDELASYELITVEMYEAKKPKVPCINVMRKMFDAYNAGDFVRLEKMYDTAERHGYDLEAIDTLLGEMVAGKHLEGTFRT